MHTLVLASWFMVIPFLADIYIANFRIEKNFYQITTTATRTIAVKLTRAHREQTSRARQEQTARARREQTARARREQTARARQEQIARARRDTRNTLIAIRDMHLMTS